ncbi:MAG TPA: alcohol dehydrogenase catalytic domain-containing protein [Acidothermaceae bacterium]|nr:alcohol dehydrogenase catalytic domain-containing protein [Acidothermaceae bacterium]
MRAFVINGPQDADVVDVEAPTPDRGQVVVDVERVGVCGTDVDLFDGTMPYLLEGHERYPLRPGHEWSGTVSAIGPDVDERWRGTRVTGDTMLGCGNCARCLRGRHHVCENRYEIGIRGGWAGALAEQLLVPVTALHRLPDELGATAGALVEPAGCALRAVEAASISAGDRVCVWGPGTLGLLILQFAKARGAFVDVVGLDHDRLALAARLGAATTMLATEADQVCQYDAVIDASTSPRASAQAVRQVEPSGRIVLVGLASTPSSIDTRDLVFNDITMVGILAASAGLDGAIAMFASGAIETDPLVAATVKLEDVADVLAGRRPANAGPGPKIHVDPRA